MPDTDLKIRGGGGGCLKDFFSALRASVWSKNKGEGPFPGSATKDDCRAFCSPYHNTNKIRLP